ncbi:zinc knuckle-domain-containing protein [Cladorrhinum sp. PSN332]|nr:zinc knuckle-domain-containing protein [Cladorrhinum sp. PSN332]
MYRSRGAPNKTPANVQCQKCLERGHYSYQCKASTQERPYIARPSRTQQLFNPKLLPKLTNAVPEDLQHKKGVADQELAKREAERVRKRELEKGYDDDDDEEGNGATKDASPPRHRREPSYDSVSSISTRSPRSPAPNRDGGEQPVGSDQHYSRDPSEVSNRSRFRSPQERGYGDYIERGKDWSPPRRRSPSPRPERRHGRERKDRRSRSPPRGHSPSSPRDRDYDRGRESRPAEHGKGLNSRRSYSRSRSRSPIRSPLRRKDKRDDRGREYRDRDQPPIQRQQHRPPPRERSLSPFSKRLALTQAMNMGGK